MADRHHDVEPASWFPPCNLPHPNAVFGKKITCTTEPLKGINMRWEKKKKFNSLLSLAVLSLGNYIVYKLRASGSRYYAWHWNCFWMHGRFLVSLSLKGIVHPKMKIVIIYSPSSRSKPVWMSLFCRTQRKIFWRKFVTRLFWGTIDFHSRKKYILWKSMVPQNCSVSHILQNIFLCVQQNKDIHTGLELLEDE